MLYYLKRKNENIALIDFSPNGDIYEVHKIMNYELCPLHMPNDFNWLKRWWRRRSVPISQGNIRFQLEKKGLLGSEEFLFKNLGLSLTDYYWICPVNSELTWENINFFDNKFVENIMIGEIGNILQDGMPHFTPNCSLQGTLEKSWVIINGERGLLKGNSNNYSSESINEIISSRLHELQGFDNYTRYYLKKISGKNYDYGCFSKLFTSQKLELVHAYDIECSEKKPNDISTYEHFLSVSAKHGLNKDELRSYMDYMIATDFILSERDRHLCNIAALRDADTLKFVKPAPIYDSGKCLFVNDSIPSTDKGLLSIHTVSFMADELRMLKLVKDRSLVDVTKLPSRSFIEKIYTMDSQMDEKRISAICNAYERKIDLFRMYQLGEDLSEIKFAVNTKSRDNTGMNSYLLDNELDKLDNYKKNEKDAALEELLQMTHEGTITDYKKELASHREEKYSK